MSKDRMNRILSLAFAVSLTPALPAQQSTEAAAENTEATAKIQGEVPRKTVRRKGEINFDDLKFDIEKGGEFQREMLTKEIEALNKKTVRIRGYIYPTFQREGIKEFVLVRDNLECCFGPGAAIFDCIRVKMEPGKTATYTTRPVAVRGKFEIDEFRIPDGPLLAIYKLTAIEVQ
ncbi:MAG: DUF3299 domain-containing protein [Planctomycetales bacterium]|nr:DUF3299 domain-containing protein [Planctomycetales bacterium]